jgi:hypothetical protein
MTIAISNKNNDIRIYDNMDFDVMTDLNSQHPQPTSNFKLEFIPTQPHLREDDDLVDAE